MAGNPLVQLFQQLRATVDVLKLEVERRRLAIFGAEHIDNALSAAFQSNAVQLAVAGGLNIQRKPLERRAIIGMGF